MKKLLLSAVVLAFTIYQGCGTEKKADPVTKSQQEIFSYFPSETQFILYMNLTELRKTEFWNDYFKPSLTKDTINNWLTDFEEKTGTGLQQGISEIVTATTWNGNDVFGIRFDGNTAKVKEYFLTEDKFTYEEKNGKKVFSMKDASSAKFYFPKDDLLLIVKDQEYLSRLLAGEQDNFITENELFPIIEKIKNKKHYWMATNKGGFAAGLIGLLSGNKEFPVKKIISSVKEISLSAQFTDGVDITSVLSCTDSKHAYLLSTGVRSALAMDLLANKDYALNQILKKLEIQREAKDVFFEINIDKEELAGLKKLAEKKKLSQTL